MGRDIKERTYAFGLEIVRLSKRIPDDRTGRVLGNQVLKSGTSIGANVQEATAAYSREEFTYRMTVALRESRETLYWLNMIRDAGLVKADDVQDVLRESEEIGKVIGAIIKTTRRNTIPKPDRKRQ